LKSKSRKSKRNKRNHLPLQKIKKCKHLSRPRQTRVRNNYFWNRKRNWLWSRRTLRRSIRNTRRSKLRLRNLLHNWRIQLKSIRSLSSTNLRRLRMSLWRWRPRKRRRSTSLSNSKRKCNRSSKKKRKRKRSLSKKSNQPIKSQRPKIHKLNQLSLNQPRRESRRNPQIWPLRNQILTLIKHLKRKLRPWWRKRKWLRRLLSRRYRRRSKLLPMYQISFTKLEKRTKRIKRSLMRHLMYRSSKRLRRRRLIRKSLSLHLKVRVSLKVRSIIARINIRNHRSRPNQRRPFLKNQRNLRKKAKKNLTRKTLSLKWQRLTRP